jgi:acyl dehydratase
MYVNRRMFDWSSHEQFARGCCDFNPIHMDAVAARRTPSGVPIVHGIHCLIWVMDCIAKRRLAPPGARRLKAQFLQPIYVGDEVALEIAPSQATPIRARAMVNDQEVLTVTFAVDDVQSPRLSSGPDTPVPPNPNDLTLSEMAGLSGSLRFPPAITQLGASFPHAVEAFGMQRIAALACSSSLVGMIVPGLHSLYSGLDVSFADDDAVPADTLQFAVASVVERFRLVRIAVGGRALRGSLETVSRLPPVRQPGIGHVSALVARNEFSAATALVIGGSRGLGELTAKIVAAGGGSVIVTYAVGRRDADAVAEEIVRFGGRCTVLAYDVRQPPAEQLAALDAVPTHLYYFATPPIFRRKSGLFNAARFDEFNLFYVTAFFELVQACLRSIPQGLRVFYPSSVAVAERPGNMTEYSMAKAAAEVLCADLTRFVPGVRMVVRRLPRLPTDQTNSVVQAKTIDPVEVILPIVREMHAQG